MNSDNVVARVDATFENTLHLDTTFESTNNISAEFGDVYHVGSNKVIYNTTAYWDARPQLVAQRGYIYIYSDYKQKDEKDVAGFKVGDGSSLLIELPFTDEIIYDSIEDIIERLTTAEGSITSLETDKLDKVDPESSGTFSHTGDVSVSGSVTAESFSGNLTGNVTGTASRATEADHAAVATNANHALTADSAGYATSANSATNASHATNADYAASAGSATEATHATSADSATSATSADSATYATSAGSADSATNADHATSADSATTAGSADSATYATDAGHADTADNATNATYATDAGHADTADSATNADYATSAGSATEADHATAADSATNADHATTADSATTASSATTATSADYATTAGNADTVNDLTVLTAVPANAVFTDTDTLAALKDVDFTNLMDGQVIVWDATAQKFKNITWPDAVVFKGSLGTGGTISVLPADGTARIGDMYKVITDGTYASQTAKVGDTFICITKTIDSNTWVYIPSGDEPSGTVTSVKIEATSPIVVDSADPITSSGVRTLSHADSGAAAGSYGDSSAQTPTYGATFKVPYITVDAKGHITGISEHTVKIPESDNTDELSELTDVNLTSPTQGQILKYNGSTWENADEVVPTEVVANPSGTATTDLTKIQVGNNIYAIPEGGTDVEVTQIQSTGTKIATITVDNVPTDLYAPAGGGSGSHTIIDDEGTELEQRSGLQFKGAYSEDNSTDDVTEVNVVREMTYSEYEQLSDDEKTGLINITDVTGVEEGKFQPVIYSGEEREIGVWKDGKPLYQKTILSSSSSLADIPIDTIVGYDSNGSMALRNNGTYMTINSFISGNSNYSWVVTFSVTNGVWSIDIRTAGVTLTWWYVTILYTKTTDTPSSGKWTPQGVPAVHYSTSEQVIGTWIDGKPLYELTIDLSSNPVSFVYNNWIDLVNAPANVNFIASAELRTSSIYMGPVEAAVRSGKWSVQRLGTNTSDSRSISYATFRYTKSS